MPTTRLLTFRAAWWSINLLFAATILSLIYSGGWEYSVRHYLRGFSDAIVPAAAAPDRKVEAILNWMRSGPPRSTADPEGLSGRDPEVTLNYKQLLAVCGSATNAFLNLSRSAGLNTRRLLLLTPNSNTKHVVAEVFIDDRWVVVDPSYRLFLRDAQGHYVTRTELRDPAVWAQATGVVPNYPREYTYTNFAHVRLARLPMDGFHLRAILESVSPNWEEAWDWSLLLERESFFALVASVVLALFFLTLRSLLAWYADYRLGIPRFHFCEHFLRAGAAFFSTPEIRQ